MRRVFVHLCLLLWLVGAAAASAQTFSLTDGTSVSGELISADDRGVVFRTPEGQTLDRVSWIKFSQDSLKTLMKNPKTARYVEPFLDVDVSQKAQKREVNIRELEKPPREAASSFLGGFLGSGFGLLILFLAYGASIYAGYEVAIVRAYPWPLVCGVAAVAPIIGPVVFLCLPTRVVSHADDGDAEWKTYDGGGVMAAEAEAAAAVSDDPEAGLAVADAPASAGPAMPATERYPRGQFTFNRRFFETKFPSWFTVIRREADKELVVIFKTARGTYTTTRFSRITTNDITVLVSEGSASKDVTVSYQEIQEVMLKHKDSPDR